jgi:hypothetical protein
MVNGEQLRDHALIRLPFTLYRLPRRYALSALRFAANKVSHVGQLTFHYWDSFLRSTTPGAVSSSRLIEPASTR